MEDENWLRFEKSGKVADYLTYNRLKAEATAAKQKEKAENNADNHESACNKGTVRWGE